ncbi:nuclear transport factor 2 family protein [Nocardia sp. SYP-A9097]|uniref:nuclear transport factor 2 family protein n=1 Tax=Nocardia sp. SYP-A9097 TaxID=2663237 RepID=UPI00129B7BE9|nr:nuclear transport factor 2 family protein [Nocardia sp. SYP-A9097]MRH90264.1 nuclear transport factor 2 family protein [Nocardia sp. SYP-A9097]
MYHAIVRLIVRKTWRRVGAGDFGAAVEMAAPDVRFRFLGDTPLGADVRGQQAFRDWFDLLQQHLPGVRLQLEDVVAGGWPWNTRVAVRLRVSSTLNDGTPYRNTAIQWLTLRWGRMTDDLVLEDTLTLDAALRQQNSLSQ